MSDRPATYYNVVMLVLESKLPPSLKFTATIMACKGDKFGGSIRPSVRTVARLSGRTERQERTNISALCAMGVLVPDTSRTGGRQPTSYHLNLAALAPTHTDPTPEVGFRPPRKWTSGVNPQRPRKETTITPETSFRPPRQCTSATPEVGFRRSVLNSL